MTEYLLKRLLRINKVMTDVDAAKALCVSPPTVVNWRNRPHTIPAGKIAAIKKLHVQLRGKIAWAEKKERMK